MVDLFGTRGDPSWCWCQFFLTTGGSYTTSAAENRDALACRRPVARDRACSPMTRARRWAGCRSGRAPGYPRITGNRALNAVSGRDIDDAGVWAVTCFVTKVGHRRRGVGAALLDAAVAHARSAGAHTLEGHPVDVSARTGRPSGAELYHGVLSTFLAAGFTEVGRTGPTRPVVRLALG